MVTTEMDPEPYRTKISNGTVTLYADTKKGLRGGATGLRPHELLEAALASCINMTLRISAEQHNIPLEQLKVSVRVIRDQPEHSRFDCTIEMGGTMTEEQRQHLLRSASHCPVSQTLSKPMQIVINS